MSESAPSEPMAEKQLLLPERAKRRENLGGVRFEGFTPEQAAWVRSQMELTGLPLDRVSEVKYERTPPPYRRLGLCDLETGEITLYRSLEDLAEIAQFGTIIHEMAHDADPFNPENNFLFGGEENRQRAATHAHAAAEQSLATNRFLNPYHKYLAEQLHADKIDRQRFDQETHAIMIELRFANQKHLEEVQDAQMARGGKTRLVTASDSAVAEGVDATLLHLVRGVSSYGDLVKHLEEVKKSFSTKGKGLTPKPTQPQVPLHAY